MRSELFAPMVFKSSDPDRVSQAVVDEEMSLFMSFAGQNRAVGG